MPPLRHALMSIGLSRDVASRVSQTTGAGTQIGVALRERGMGLRAPGHDEAVRGYGIKTSGASSVPPDS